MNALGRGIIVLKASADSVSGLPADTKVGVGGAFTLRFPGIAKVCEAKRFIDVKVRVEYKDLFTGTVRVEESRVVYLYPPR